MSPRTSAWVIAVGVSGLLLQPVFGQGRGGGTPPAGGSTGTGSTGTGTGSTGTGVKAPSIPTNPTTNPTTPQPTSLPQPIYVSGRVMMEDGAPPPEPVTIERVCSGSPHAEGYTDTKGYFGIQLGRNNGVMQDASETAGYGGVFSDPNDTGGLGGRQSLGGVSSGGSTEMRFMACELRARLAGYRSQSVSLANRRAMDNPDIGVILLHRMVPTEGTTVSTASLSAPKDARKAFEKGQDALKKKKFDDAAKGFQKAVDLYPGYATAWHELGRLQAASGAPDSARISFECAMKADPKYTAPYVELATIEVQAKKWKEVASITDRAARLDSFDYPEIFFYNAVANFNLKNVEAAEKSVRQALKLDTQHHYPQASYLLGVILSNRREYADAQEQFRTYLKLAPTAPDAPTAKLQLDRIEKISTQGALAAPKQDQ